MDMAVLSLSSSLSPDLGDNVAGCGVAPVINHPVTKAATVRLRSDWPRLRSGFLTEMFCRIRAEIFGPLAERVFHCESGHPMSALPPKADVNGYGAGGPLLTQSGSREDGPVAKDYVCRFSLSSGRRRLRIEFNETV